MRNWLLAAGAAALSLCAGAAATQEFTPEAFSISELRGGILAHSVDDSGPVNIAGVGNFARIQDFNVELLFTPPDADLWRIIGNPRPHLGATVNLGGLESMAYAGLTWHLPIFDTPFFIEGGLGGALTNGANSGAVYPARSLGCNLLFHEQVSIGYQFSENANIMLTGEHASHAGLCPNPDNRGLTNVGVRVGFTF
jgi:hypothetical protein